MPVDVHGDRYGFMAHELLHVAFVRAQGQKNRCKAVPEVVKPEIGREPELLFYFAPLKLSPALRPHRAVLFIAREKPGLGSTLKLPQFQHNRELGPYRNDRLASPGFQVRNNSGTVLLFDEKRVVLEIAIFPLEAEDLPDPQPREHAKPDNRFVPERDVPQHEPELLRSEGRVLCVWLRGKLSLDRICCEELPLHSPVEDFFQGPHGIVCDRRCFVFYAVALKLAHVVRGELSDFLVAEHGNDVIPTGSLVFHECRIPIVHSFVLLEVFHTEPFYGELCWGKVVALQDPEMLEAGPGELPPQNRSCPARCGPLYTAGGSTISFLFFERMGISAFIFLNFLKIYKKNNIFLTRIGNEIN
jgi:hypothetical protein